MPDSERKAARARATAPHAARVRSRGPFLALLLRVGLLDENMRGVARCAAVLVAIAWLPLVLLAFLDGRLVGGAVVPLLQDADVTLRLLVVVPLLIAGERVIHERWPSALARFESRALVAPEERARFEAAVDAAARAMASPWLEAVLVLAVAVGGAAGLARTTSGLGVATWYVDPAVEGAVLRPAAYWLLSVSLPLFQFLLLRWYARLAIWWWLLLRLSRLDLRLQPLHPDQSGGLAFLGTLCLAFEPLCAAHGAVAAGWIANRILHLGATLPQFRVELATLVALQVVAILGPLLAFAMALDRAKRASLGRFGNFAMRYAREFDDKWLAEGTVVRESPIGSGDIQSLADLGTSYGSLRQMRVLPFATSLPSRLTVAVLVPVAPLVLTMVPLEELLGRLARMIL